MRAYVILLAVISGVISVSPAVSQSEEGPWIVCMASKGSNRLVTSPAPILHERFWDAHRVFEQLAADRGLTEPDCRLTSRLDQIPPFQRPGLTYKSADGQTNVTVAFTDIPVDWHSRSTFVAKPTAESTPSPSLTVEDTGEWARLKAWDDSILQARRSEAQRKVAQAVISAKLDAQVKARAAQVLERYRKQGRKQ